MPANYDLATPTFQQVLETRRLNTEAGLEPFDARDLRVHRHARTARAVEIVASFDGDAANPNPPSRALGER